jgi:NAD+ synthase (glutamine-hydrolysing)
MQDAGAERYHHIEAPIALSRSKFDIIEELNRPAARPYEVWYHAPEIMVVGVGADDGWLWDYLHCSRTQVYFLPVSDGINNCATAMIIYSMCGLAIDAAQNGSTSE